MNRSVLAVLLYAFAFGAPARDACLDTPLGSLDAGALKGQIVVSTLDAKGGRETRVLAPPSATALTGSEGFRIASITKTYVAATALRLQEDGKLDLGDPITRHLPPDWIALLRKDGYKPQDITVRHLLSHTAGLADHARAPQFIAAVQAEPSTKWTPKGDVERLVEWTEPVGTPGQKYAYSDTGYVMLGTIIERVTGQSLPQAVRTQLQLDRRDVPDTYWERYETAAGRTRVHQFFEGQDTYDWDPSMDLFGGGGLVATPADLTTFFDALLRGQVFNKPQTLALMQSRDGLPAGTPYRLGLLDYDVGGGVHATGHSGFWGTLVMREPNSGRTIAGAVTRREEYPQLKSLIEAYVREVATAEPGKAPSCAVSR